MNLIKQVEAGKTPLKVKPASASSTSSKALNEILAAKGIVRKGICEVMQ